MTSSLVIGPAEREARWRAAGNRSRIVIDTSIKVGDRVRVHGASSGCRTYCNPESYGLGYGAEHDEARRALVTPEILEIRERGFARTVTEIEYVGTYTGNTYVRMRAGSWPSFKQFTTITFRCDIDGVERIGHPDDMVPL